MEGQRQGRATPSDLSKTSRSEHNGNVSTPNTMRITWRPPDAHCDRGGSSAKRTKMKLEKKMPISLNDQVAHPDLMWQTPRASAAMSEDLRQHQVDPSGQGEIGGASSEDDANSNEEGLQGIMCKAVINSTRDSLLGLRVAKDNKEAWIKEWWSVEPNVGRVAHGVPGRVDRLKGLGSSIVPQIVEEIAQGVN